ncbi:MAG: response regulator [Chloroflexi bacterium]|nr:response regulator [Chloroflexota bacterium]
MSTILLVEDNRIDETLIRQILKEDGFEDDQVISARDGLEALDYLFGSGAYAGRNANALPSLMILDLHLPKISGLEVLKRVRSDPRTLNLPVAIFSSSLDTDDLITSDGLGVTSYIHKSSNLTAYAADVRELVHHLKENK